MRIMAISTANQNNNNRVQTVSFKMKQFKTPQIAAKEKGVEIKPLKLKENELREFQEFMKNRVTAAKIGLQKAIESAKKVIL